MTYKAEYIADSEMTQGWYLVDEDGDIHDGPYETKEEVENELDDAWEGELESHYLAQYAYACGYFD